MPTPDIIALWLPRRDEFDLARSLVLTDHPTFEQAEEVARAVAADLRSRGHRVRLGRWHVAKVIRAMKTLDAPNTPEGRAAAIGWIARERDEDTP